MPLVPLPLALKSNPARDVTAGAARLINAYPELVGEEGKSAVQLYAIDGLTLFSTLTGGGVVRAILGFDATKCFVVAGTKVFSLASNGTATELTGSVSGSGRVAMARNRLGEVGIVIAGAYYQIAADGSTLTTVDISALVGTAVDVVHVDGYFILIMDTGEWYISGIDDADTFSALDFEDTASSHDGLLSGAVRGSDVALFGEVSTEFWSNTGGGDFPFSRVTTRRYGCYAGQSVKPLMVIRGESPVTETVIWCATNDEGAFTGVCLLEGYEAVKISPLALDRLISDETTPANIVATTWAKNGHAFYQLAGPTWCWVYDTATGQWHERASTGLDRYRVQHSAQMGPKTIVGHYNSNVTYEVNPDDYDEDGTAIPVTIITPPLHDYPNRLRCFAVFADAVAGVGLVSGDAADTNPKIGLRLSRDGGATWTTKRERPIGTNGARTQRCRWYRQGMSGEDGFTFELTCSARVLRGILGAYVDVVSVDR